MRGLLAHLRLELALLFRNGESLLLTMGIPVLLLAFFSKVEVLPIDGKDVDFLAPGVLALAVLSTAMVQTAIGTGFTVMTKDNIDDPDVAKFLYTG